MSKHLELHCKIDLETISATRERKNEICNGATSETTISSLQRPGGNRTPPARPPSIQSERKSKQPKQGAEGVSYDVGGRVHIKELAAAVPVAVRAAEGRLALLQLELPLLVPHVAAPPRHLSRAGAGAGGGSPARPAAGIARGLGYFAPHPFCPFLRFRFFN